MTMTSTHPKQKILETVGYHTGTRVIKDVWDLVWDTYKKQAFIECNQPEKITRMYNDMHFSCSQIHALTSITLGEYDFSGKND